MSYLLLLGPLVQHIPSKVKVLRQWLFTAIYGFKVSKSQRCPKLVIFVKVPASWLCKPDESERLVAEKNHHDSRRTLSIDMNVEVLQPVGVDEWRALVSPDALWWDWEVDCGCVLPPTPREVGEHLEKTHSSLELWQSAFHQFPCHWPLPLHSMIRLYLKQNKTNDYRIVRLPSCVPTLSPNQTIDNQNICCHNGHSSPTSVCLMLYSNCIFKLLSLNFLFQ